MGSLVVVLLQINFLLIHTVTKSLNIAQHSAGVLRRIHKMCQFSVTSLYIGSA